MERTPDDDLILPGIITHRTNLETTPVIPPLHKIVLEHEDWLDIDTTFHSLSGQRQWWTQQYGVDTSRYLYGVIDQVADDVLDARFGIPEETRVQLIRPAESLGETYELSDGTGIRFTRYGPYFTDPALRAIAARNVQREIGDAGVNMHEKSFFEWTKLHRHLNEDHYRALRNFLYRGEWAYRHKEASDLKLRPWVERQMYIWAATKAYWDNSYRPRAVNEKQLARKVAQRGYEYEEVLEAFMTGRHYIYSELFQAWFIMNRDRKRWQNPAAEIISMEYVAAEFPHFQQQEEYVNTTLPTLFPLSDPLMYEGEVIQSTHHAYIVATSHPPRDTEGDQASTIPEEPASPFTPPEELDIGMEAENALEEQDGGNEPNSSDDEDEDAPMDADQSYQPGGVIRRRQTRRGEDRLADHVSETNRTHAMTTRSQARAAARASGMRDLRRIYAPEITQPVLDALTLTMLGSDWKEYAYGVYNRAFSEHRDTMQKKSVMDSFSERLGWKMNELNEKDNPDLITEYSGRQKPDILVVNI